MGRPKTKEKILKATSGVFTAIIDFVLFNLEILGELSTIPAGSRTMSNAQKVLTNTALGIHKKEIQKALYRAKSHGWIKMDMRLTEEGKKRLKSTLPILLSQKKWDRNWYLVIFDIPEKLRKKRNILREKLKELGFGQLQQSVWISPINYLPILEKIIFNYQLEPFVIFSQTNKIGRETSQELTERVWKLKKLNQEYQRFISNWKKAENKKEKALLQMKYLQILAKDPQLPKELLPKDWAGNKVHRLIKNFKIFKLIKQ